MSNTSIAGIVTVASQTSPSWLLVAQSDQPVLSILENWLLNYTQYSCYQTHIAAAPGHKLIKPIRVWQYGEGTLTNGLMILSVDKQRREAYTVTFTDLTEDGDLLFKQDLSGSLIGHQWDVTMYLAGYGLVLRETVLEFSDVQPSG